MRALQANRIGVSHLDWAARVFWVAVWLALMAFLAPRFVVGDDASSVWRSDFDAALKEAEERKVPLLLHFYADWCVPCKKMDQTVFATAQVKEMLSSRFVAVKLNSDKNQRLVQRYGVEILPSDVVIDPLTGRIIKGNSGLLNQAQYVSMAQEVEASFLKSHPPEQKIADATPEGTVSVARVEVPQLGEPRPVVGLDGFSPVALRKGRKWIRGSAQFAWDHKGVLYYCTTREELVEFRKNPELFAPKMLGCDPVILWESDRAVAGNVEFGAFFDDELYLFKSDERRKQFKANPVKFTRLQHALKASQIEQTVVR